MLRLIIAFFFHFCFFSISHSNVIRREICVKDFSGTTAPRILKLGTNVGYDLLYCVRENVYYFLYLSIFISLQSNFLLQISWLPWEPESSNFLYTFRVAKCVVGQKTKMLRFIFTIFFHFCFFSISHSNVIHREICVKDFSGTTAPRILKFGTNVGYDFIVLCKRESACCCLSFPLFVHFSFFPVKLFVIEFSAPITARVFKFLLRLEGGQVYCGKENQDSVIKFCHLFPFFHLSLQCNT